LSSVARESGIPAEDSAASLPRAADYGRRAKTPSVAKIPRHPCRGRPQRVRGAGAAPRTP